MPMTGPVVAAALEACSISHVVWIPDSVIGTWEAALVQSRTLQLVRACREGEAIAIAGGLLLGGARPLVMLQCTGLFEAGDALRNIVHDLRLPLPMIVGVRNELAFRAGTSTDNCPRFTTPILNVWELPVVRLDPRSATGDDLVTALRHWRQMDTAGAVLLAE